MKEPKYTITDETGCHKRYIYRADAEALYDVVEFKAMHPKARVPKEFWADALQVLDKLFDTIEAVNDKCTDLICAVEDINRCVPNTFMPSGMRAAKKRLEEHETDKDG